MNLEEIKKYGQSANGIPVDRVTLKKAEFDEIISEVERMQEENEKAVDIAEANIRAEIANAGTSCHWCMDKTKKQTAEECAKIVRKCHDDEYEKATAHFHLIVLDDLEEAILTEIRQTYGGGK